eukprot:2025-Heterococcus_DN1.PRE.1
MHIIVQRQCTLADANWSQHIAARSCYEIQATSTSSIRFTYMLVLYTSQCGARTHDHTIKSTLPTELTGLTN